jgi:hypothetical protein
VNCPFPELFQQRQRTNSRRLDQIVKLRMESAYLNTYGNTAIYITTVGDKIITPSLGLLLAQPTGGPNRDAVRSLFGDSSCYR